VSNHPHLDGYCWLIHCHSFVSCVVLQEGHEPLQSCLRDRGHRNLIAQTLETLQVLVSFGAAWDTKCDAFVVSGKAWKVAPALRICMLLWAQERTDGLPFTNIPVEAIRRGVDGTQAYIDDWKRSSTTPSKDLPRRFELRWQDQSRQVHHLPTTSIGTRG
jgi:hypothetical protein